MAPEQRGVGSGEEAISASCLQEAVSLLLRLMFICILGGEVQSDHMATHS